MSPSELPQTFPESESEEIRRVNLFSHRSLVWLSLAGFSVFYFVDVCLRASAKYFWYDEILTLYCSRLPNVRTLWAVLQTGVDSNPPGFHLLTRGVESIFGEGLIATRLPEIVGFWIFCLCMFKFVERRAGWGAGLIALSFPMTTGAYFYAYEARPLILVTALASIALLCNDKAIERPANRVWLIAFSLSLFAAFMLHCYAILLVFPFAFYEFVRDIRVRRVNWSFWVALILPAVTVIPLYLSLLRIVSATKGANFMLAFPPIWSQAWKFYSFLLDPCITILLISVVLFWVDRRVLPNGADRELSRIRFRWEEAALIVGFLALPAIGVILGQIVKSPYFGRYFLSALIGLVIPLSINAGARRSRNVAIPLLAALIALTLSLNLVRLLRHHRRGTGEVLLEPSTGVPLATTRGKPFEWEPLLAYTSGDATPLAVLDSLTFLSVVEYWPALKQKTYLINASHNPNALKSLREFRLLSPVPFNLPMMAPDFIKSFPTFYLYAERSEVEDVGRIARLANITQFKSEENHVLLRMNARTE